MPVKLQSVSDDDEARIEVIPLIDIMFFLLAAFMLVSLSMTQLHRVPITLPGASTGVADSQAPPVLIAVDANGVTTWDQKIVTLSEITNGLKAMTKTEQTQVLIAADEEARHKQVLSVLNAVREAGIEKVSFESKKTLPN